MIKIYLREQKECLSQAIANLVSSWIPALDNGIVEQALKKDGLKVADIGCGYGVSTILMVHKRTWNITGSKISGL
jgi:methylase of polypeptide subunit release factors